MVDAVAIETDTVVTALTCDDAGTPRQATLRVALTSVGSVMWFAGDNVHLKAFREVELDFGVDDRFVTLLALEETPLMIGYQGGIGTGTIHWFGLTGEAQFPCGEEDDVNGNAGMPYELMFGFGEASVPIMHRHRGVLPFDGSQVFAIDLGQATANYCCHYSRKISVLIRRVMPL